MLELLYGMKEQLADAAYYGLRATTPRSKRLESLAAAREFSEPFGRFVRFSSSSLGLDENQRKLVDRVLEVERPRVRRNPGGMLLEYAHDGHDRSGSKRGLPDFFMTTATGSLRWSLDRGPVAYLFSRQNSLWPCAVEFLFLDTIPHSDDELREQLRIPLPRDVVPQVNDGTITLRAPGGAAHYRYLGENSGSAVWAHNTKHTYGPYLLMKPHF